LKQKILGVDLDSTLADIMPVFCLVVREQFGKSIHPSQIDNWDFWDPVIGPDAKWHIFREVWRRWREVQPTEPDLSSKLVKAIGMGYEISIITSTQKENLPFVHRWLELHKIPYKSIVALFNGQSKTDYPWHALVDDNPSLAKKPLPADRKVFMYEQPWNKSVQFPLKVKTFDEVLQDL
jgi:5'(3')-deoxyribonucleotidase